MMRRICLLLRLLIAGMLLCLAGCATVDPLPFRDPTIKAFWPAPPAPPRVQFLREIDSPDDIIPAKGKVEKVLELVTGDNQPKLDFGTPYGIASDGGGVIFIADSMAGVVHRYDLAHREVSYIAQAADEILRSPVGVALDSDGNLYVSDSLNAAVYKFDAHGLFVRKLSSPIAMKRPAGIAVNGLGEKFIVDVRANRLLVFDKNDNYLREFPNSAQGEELNYPSNVAVDRFLNVYVADSLNFTLNVYDHAGNLKRKIGQAGDSPGSFSRPKGVAVDSDDNIYVVDAGNDNFQIFSQGGAFLLIVGKNGNRPGEFFLPSGISIDKHDRIFVTDTYNRRIQIFQYLKEGVKR